MNSSYHVYQPTTYLPTTELESVDHIDLTGTAEESASQACSSRHSRLHSRSHVIGKWQSSIGPLAAQSHRALILVPGKLLGVIYYLL